MRTTPSAAASSSTQLTTLCQDLQVDAAWLVQGSYVVGTYIRGCSYRAPVGQAIGEVGDRCGCEWLR
jgi:hypothetical protein